MAFAESRRALTTLIPKGRTVTAPCGSGIAYFLSVRILAPKWPKWGCPDLNSVTFSPGDTLLIRSEGADVDVRALGSPRGVIRFRVEGHIHNYSSHPFSVRGMKLRLSKQRWVGKADLPATGQGLTLEAPEL